MDAWVLEQLRPDEWVAHSEVLHGGISTAVRKLNIVSAEGSSRALVLRLYDDRVSRPRAERLLSDEANTLRLLGGTDIPAPELVAVDATGARSGRPALLMTCLPGRTRLEDNGIELRVVQLARQLVDIHRLDPGESLPFFETLSTPESAVLPTGAETRLWSAAIDLIRAPAPSYEGRMLHRDFQPGNVLFDDAQRLTGVVDWAAACWGPADLEVAHCATNLALLHGPAWGLRFVDAYERAGGALAAEPGARRYWLVRDVLAASEELREISTPWRELGRPELTPYVLGERLSAYLRSVVVLE
ncbi:phosphotransferase family protein [Flexivirga meconopsidis]|uniref:phosphotransferase family protein n=1 Tax=Flexivirga meconopsidis TaxID=2977121 RepID=UPI00224078B8